MSIYSANRTGSMGLAQVNEAYGSNDLGRIMYESQVNDMAFFEGMLACDFNEITGLQEGTLLESEIAALNEASLKAFAQKAIARLKAFWEKIKGAFKNAIDKIGAYILNNGKAYVKNFRTIYTNPYNGKWNGTVEKVAVYTNGDATKVPSAADIEGLIRSQKDDENLETNKIAAEYLSKLVKKTVTTKEYLKVAMEACKSEENLTAKNVDEYLDTIEKGSATIKALKEQERNTERAIKQAVDTLKKAENGDTKKANVARINALVSAYETVISCTTRASIAVVRADLKSKRTALEKVLSDIRKAPKVLHNSAVVDAAEEFDDAMTTGEALDSDTQAEVDELVNSVE